MYYKIIFLLICLMPLSVFADLEFFLSEQGSEYSQDAWTSPNYPDSTSDNIYIEYTTSVSPIPNEYMIVNTDIKEIFYDIYSDTENSIFSQEEIEQFVTEQYETLLEVETPEFIEHIIYSIDSQTDTTIEEKNSQNIVLTPHEEIFYNCNISLEERQSIVSDVLARLASWEIDNLEEITYSNPQFWDCIIPFPDVTHREKVIEESFESNQTIAYNIQEKYLEYETHESIQKTAAQSAENQESIIQHDVLYSQMFEQEVLSIEEYENLIQLEEYFSSLIYDTNISIKLIDLDQEFKSFSSHLDISTQAYSEGVIDVETYKNIIQDAEIYTYYHWLMLLWLQEKNISLADYKEYISLWEWYFTSMTQLIYDLKSGDITKKEYEKEIKHLRKQYTQRYKEYEVYFNEEKDILVERTYNYDIFILLGKIVFFIVMVYSVFIILRKYNKKKLW